VIKRPAGTAVLLIAHAGFAADQPQVAVLCVFAGEHFRVLGD